MEQKYIELLEKANQQLSYTWNPIDKWVAMQ